MRPADAPFAAVVFRFAAGLLVVLLATPLVALLAGASLADLARLATSEPVIETIRLSIGTSAAATTVAVLLGLPLARVLATETFRGKRLLETLVDLPMVLPPTVAGVALLLAFGRVGLVGRWLAPLGITIPFTTVAVVLAQVFVAAPFFVNAARAGFEEVDRRYIDAAATLRASPTHAFFRVIVPMSLPSLVAGAATTWARALGEFGATITFAGNLPGVTQTMPIAVYVALQTDLSTAITLSVFLLGVSFALLYALRAVPGAVGRGRAAR